mmetsp:Transcript_17850/g.59790  ORF Transcript_17850/g.59790 Transcript_17850/m.59790 type:complete len:501 (+) Transcript_17850:188-1690(+)
MRPNGTDRNAVHTGPSERVRALQLQGPPSATSCPRARVLRVAVSQRVPRAVGINVIARGQATPSASGPLAGPFPRPLARPLAELLPVPLAGRLAALLAALLAPLVRLPCRDPYGEGRALARRLAVLAQAFEDVPDALDGVQDDVGRDEGQQAVALGVRQKADGADDAWGRRALRVTHGPAANAGPPSAHDNAMGVIRRGAGAVEQRAQPRSPVWRHSDVAHGDQELAERLATHAHALAVEREAPEKGAGRVREGRVHGTAEGVDVAAGGRRARAGSHGETRLGKEHLVVRAKPLPQEAVHAAEEAPRGPKEREQARRVHIGARAAEAAVVLPGCPEHARVSAAVQGDEGILRRAPAVHRVGVHSWRQLVGEGLRGHEARRRLRRGASSLTRELDGVEEPRPAAGEQGVFFREPHHGVQLPGAPEGEGRLGEARGDGREGMERGRGVALARERDHVLRGVEEDKVGAPSWPFTDVAHVDHRLASLLGRYGPAVDEPDHVAG